MPNSYMIGIPMSRNSSARRFPAGRVLFPRTPRSFPGRRGLKILLRAAHVLSAGVLCGAYLLDVGPPARTPRLVAAALSGLLIVLLDLLESGTFMLQLRGLYVAVKIALLAALPWFGEYAGLLLAILVVLSVLSSHAPGKVRYFLVFGAGRVTGSDSKG